MKLHYSKFSAAGINALPRFGNNVNIAEFAKTIKPKSKYISLYIHIPFCKSICSFCMLRRGAKSKEAVPDNFVDALLSEAKLHKNRLKHVFIDAIYFGGGTPSLLSGKQFEKIILTLSGIFNFSHELEITFEGEAQTLQNIELLASLKSYNVQRISFGLQTFDKEQRVLLGRTDTLEDIFKTTDKLNHFSFPDINVDYLYNLPNTDIKFLRKDLKKLKSLSVSSVDCHPLKYVSCSKGYLTEVVNKQMQLPNSQLRIDMFNEIREWAFLCGYKEQFVDQYSKSDLINSNKYMQHLYGQKGGEYLGIGPGARSHIDDVGLSNTQNIHTYYKTILDEKRIPTSRIVDAALNDNYVTCFPKRNKPLYKSDIDRTSNPLYFSEKLSQLIHGGYIDYTTNMYTLTRLGLSWYQNLQEDLLSPTQKDNHMQSKILRKHKLNGFNDYFDQLG